MIAYTKFNDLVFGYDSTPSQQALAKNRIESQGHSKLSAFEVKKLLSPTLKETQDAALLSIQSFSDSAVLAMTESPTQVEVDTWPLKMITADAIVNGTPITVAGAAYLAAMKITTAAAKKSWAGKVQANAKAYATVAGVADYLKTASKQAVLAAKTNDEVAAVLAGAEQQATDAITNLKKAANNA